MREGLEWLIGDNFRVQDEVRGRRADGIAVVPRQALRGSEQVLVVDEENRLRFRDVEVLRIDGENVLIASGLAPGEKVCTSLIQAPVDGMRVRAVADDETPRGAQA